MAINGSREVKAPPGSFPWRRFGWQPHSALPAPSPAPRQGRALSKPWEEGGSPLPSDR